MIPQPRHAISILVRNAIPQLIAPSIFAAVLNLQSIGDKVKGAANSASDAIKGVGKDVKGAASSAAKSVKGAAGDAGE